MHPPALRPAWGAQPARGAACCRGPSDLIPQHSEGQVTPLSPPWLVARLSLRGRPLSARGHAFGCVPIREEEVVLRGAAGPVRAVRGHRHHEEASRDEAPQRGPSMGSQELI